MKVTRAVSAAALMGSLTLAIAAGDLQPPGAPSPTPSYEPRTAINSDNTPGDDRAFFVIDRRGSYYLPANFMAPQAPARHGIAIEASGVTLDLGGFTLRGPSLGGPVHGIVASGEQTNITVHSGVVHGWSGAGLDFSTVENASIFSVTASGSGGEGIVCGPGGVIRSCTVQGNGGAGIDAAASSLVSNCIARDSTPGISVEAGSVVEGCVASGNTSEGMRGIGATIARCRSDANSGRGFVLEGGTLTDSTAASNATHGVEAYANFVILNSVFQQNSGVGICAADLTGATTGGRIEGNTSTENECGVWTAAESEGLLIVRNHASNNEINYDVSGTNIVGPILTEIEPLTSTDPWANFAF